MAPTSVVEQSDSTATIRLIQFTVSANQHDAPASGFSRIITRSRTTTRWRVVLLGDATPRQCVLQIINGRCGQLALGEVQGLERFDWGEVLQAGVGDRGGVEVQRLERGEFGERGQPGVRDPAAMVEVQLAQVAERAEMLQAAVADFRDSAVVVEQFTTAKGERVDGLRQ